MDKKDFLKISGTKNLTEFYKLFPDEKSFMAKHGKEVRKALRGAAIKKAQQGDMTAYNQQNAGMNNLAATQADVQGAISNLSQGTAKKTTGQTIAGATSSIPILGKLVSGITGLFDAGAERKRQVRAGQLSDLQLAAAKSAPRQENRKYNRPDMDANVDDINSLAPADGTGTNLIGKYGIEIEPIDNRQKSYKHGGRVPQAGLGDILGSVIGGGSSGGGGGSGIVGNLLGGILGNKKAKDATAAPAPIPQPAGTPTSTQVVQSNVAQGAQTMATGLSAIPGMNSKMATSSKSIGEAVGSAIPGPIGAIASPILGAVAQGIGRIAENKSGEKAMSRIQRNNNQMATTSAAKVMQGANQNFMRTGGNLRQNSPDMENNGELQTLWGGKAESISYNPHLPEGGETVMFHGNSHEESNGRGETGIGVRYGDNLQPYDDADANVEVERGEPAVQLPDETGNNNLVVFGNLPIPKQFTAQLGPEAKGKKFKNYVSLLSKQEDKQNKIMEKANDELKELDPKDSFEKIKFDTLSLTLKGADQKLKDIAKKKENAAHLQQAINDTAEERGIDAEQLAKGTIKAKKGAKVNKAQAGFNVPSGSNPSGYAPEGDVRPTSDEIIGTNMNKQRPTSYPNSNALPDFGDLPDVSRDDYSKLQDLYEKAKSKKSGTAVKDFQQTFHKIAPQYAQRIIDKYPVTSYGKSKGTNKNLSSNEDGLFGERTIQYMQSLRHPSDIQRMTPREQLFDTPQDAIHPTKIDQSAPEKKQMPQYFNPLSPYLPNDKEELDPRQLTGEYYALATNDLEPVPAQQYHPNLRTPYELSLQDILNENTAATRGAQRMMGYNPAAQADLMGQQYNANSKVLGEQFRINQDAKTKIYDENTNILNDAQLKNLGILDQQYTRQSQAKSNTKRIAQDALSSISDKYLQNQLQNRTLATYENLYNYRFDKNQHAWNMNGPAQWNMQGNNNGLQSQGLEDLTPQERDLAIAEARVRREKKESSDENKKKRNGAILKAMRNS